MGTFSRASATGWEQGADTSSFARASATGWEQENTPVAAGISGQSGKVWTLSGAAAGTVAQAPVSPVSGASVKVWTLTGVAEGTVAEEIPTEGASDATWSFEGTARATVAQPPPLPVDGESASQWTLYPYARARIGNSILPPGWTINPVLESVPNPNFATIYGNTFFTRWTFICTDENGQFVCASGAESDCNAQAQSLAQARTQQLPYNEAI